jgi:PAS domain S-box-containing protein
VEEPTTSLFGRRRRRGGERAKATDDNATTQRELEVVAELSNAFSRARSPIDVARPLVREVATLLHVGFAGVVLVDGSRSEATGVYGEIDGRDAPWWGELKVDLRHEPSGIASAVFDAAPVTVFDVASSPLPSPRLVERVGARSGAWIPMIAEERVTGVLAIASTGEKRAFKPEELSWLQALAAEAAQSLERLRTASALSAALKREEQVNKRSLQHQAALLQAAQVVTSEFDIDTVLQRLVDEVTKLLGADAADCYLLDSERGVLRCAAVRGLDAGLVGFEFAPERGIAGAALQQARPVVADGEPPVPHEAYARFARALVAPMVWGGETRGVLGVALRGDDRSFTSGDVELLEAFASLASLALRNAEIFSEQSRQARIQLGFSRIASLLGEPLSLDETYDAAAQAAAEALGADSAAVLAPRNGGLEIVGGHGLPDAVRALSVSRAFEEASASGHVVAAPSLADDERFEDVWRRAPYASLLAIPVPGPDGVLVVVLFDEARTFVRDDLELARQVARAARGALDRSRLFEAERLARSLSQQLARAGSLLATELDPPTVLDAVVSEAKALLGADAAALTILEASELAVVAAVGERSEEALGARSAATGWVGGDVVQSRTPVVLTDVAEDPSLASEDALLAAGHRSYLGVPLRSRDGSPEGVLAVYSLAPRAWRDEERDALVALAANASVALWNAELYQRVALEREQSVAILANIADGIVAVERDGRVVLWNRAAEEITGVPASEAIGRTPAQVLQRKLESEAGGNRLIAIQRGGEEIWLSLSEAVMRDPGGVVAGRIFAFRDISAEHAVETMKSDFVSTVSIELRAPLTSIYGFAETLLREDVEFGEKERRTFLEFIARETERLTATVDALLNVARLDTGELTVSIQPTDVVPVVDEVVKGALAAENGDGHSIVADVGPAPLSAQADREKLRQVLDQLVSNAVKFSPDGGTVTVSARETAEGIELAVSDEGIGVPPSERDRIFSKFYKAGEGHGRGTGLGLFIAQGLVQEMGGKIRVDPSEGGGSRFTFALPRAQAMGEFRQREA